MPHKERGDRKPELLCHHREVVNRRSSLDGMASFHACLRETILGGLKGPEKLLEPKKSRGLVYINHKRYGLQYWSDTRRCKIRNLKKKLKKVSLVNFFQHF